MARDYLRDDEQQKFDRLPKWAQQKMDELDRKANEARRLMESRAEATLTMPDYQHFAVEDYDYSRGASTRHWLPPMTDVKFYAPGSKERPEFTIAERDGLLQIRSNDISGLLAVLPEASNVVSIKNVKDR